MTANQAVRIALFSDLHFGWRGWPPHRSRALMDHLMDHLSEHHPHIAICTGDLINGPLNPLAWYQAWRLLNGLQEKCGDRSLVLWVPGDHDLAIGGKIAVKGFAHAILGAFFSRYVLEDRLVECPALGLSLLGVGSVPPFLQSLGRRLFGHQLYPHHKVPDKTMSRLTQTLSEQPAECGDGIRKKLKIAVMHHFPLDALPADGSTTRITTPSATPLLTALAEGGTNLLLHGDVHRQVHYRLTICFDDRECEILSLCPGRIKANTPWKNSYMLITISSPSEISVQVYGMVGGRTFEPVARHDFKLPL